ncbi:hypothetical protein Cgig2_025355 [Carnegiea gigantea]|uniref:Uncharacterized protein n=1 Tax=Carnegiea gigantea TaxID=171969 RepID=A0A9Q1GIJ8_9CARY|nr:hypothetical protein Cgig2_025355 [Carnegiea gigantea]
MFYRSFYLNPTKVTHSGMDVFESKFDEPWPNWKKVPMNICDLWFGEFDTKILGREPTIDEIFMYTHTKRDSGEISSDKFVDKRSEDAHRNSKKRKDESKLPNTSAEGDAVGCTSEEVEAEEQLTKGTKEVEIWKESIGMTKKEKSMSLDFMDLFLTTLLLFKATVAEVASKLEEVQKANEEKEKEKEMERLKKENKRLKPKIK